MATLERAIAIATAAHAGQVDKGGRPYIDHVARVARAAGREVQIVAWLHDIVEDSAWTLDDLRREGFAPAVVDAVDALTKRPGEAYRDAILRVSRNALATDVKLADLADNRDPVRLHDLAAADRTRLAEKYGRAVDLLRTLRRIRTGLGTV